MTTTDDVLAAAYRFAGQPYSFGAEVPPSLDPDGVCPVDCSELVEAACRRAGVSIPDGAYNQWLTCEGIPVSQGIATRGALLFYGDGTGTGRDAITHVAFSEGDGTTFEAWKDGLPVGSYGTEGRPWTFAGLIPGLDYDVSNPTPRRSRVGIFVRHPDGMIKLVSLARFTHANIGSMDDLAELQKAVADPAHTANISEKTWDMLIASIVV